MFNFMLKWRYERSSAMAREYEIFIETKENVIRKAFDCETEDVQGEPIAKLMEELAKHKKEGVLNYILKVRDDKPPIQIENLECNVKIKLKNAPFDYDERYVFGPTLDKDFDFIGTPGAFLAKGLEMFDYHDIKEITLTTFKS